MTTELEDDLADESPSDEAALVADQPVADVPGFPAAVAVIAAEVEGETPDQGQPKDDDGEDRVASL